MLKQTTWVSLEVESSIFPQPAILHPRAANQEVIVVKSTTIKAAFDDASVANV
jgi:hypothetical protein